MNHELVALAAATEDDREFSYQVKKAAEGAYIAAIWGWDEALQRHFQAEDWAARRPDIITYGGTPVGTLYAREEDGCMQIRQFFILPGYQNQGIGSCLLRRILAKADTDGMVSKVGFLEGNRVELLYRRFGFRLTGRQDRFCFMERRPQHGSKRGAPHGRAADGAPSDR